MSLSSMTGFSRSEATYEGKKFIVEIKSLNSRYAEVHVHAPKDFLKIEHDIAAFLKRVFARGKFDVSLKVEHEGSFQSEASDKAILEKWRHLEKIRKAIKQQTPIPLEAVVPLVKISTDSLSPPKMAIGFMRVMELAVAELKKSRQREGVSLEKVIRKRLVLLEKTAKAIHQRIPLSQKERAAAMEQRLAKILNEPRSFDKKRIETEIAILLDKGDISEELERFSIHIGRFKEMLTKSEPMGREMDFLIQELNREINTMGSKSSDYAITDEVIVAKAELEKIREQVQNIE